MTNPQSIIHKSPFADHKYGSLSKTDLSSTATSTPDKNLSLNKCDDTQTLDLSPDISKADNFLVNSLRKCDTLTEVLNLSQDIKDLDSL